MYTYVVIQSNKTCIFYAAGREKEEITKTQIPCVMVVKVYLQHVKPILNTAQSPFVI